MSVSVFLGISEIHLLLSWRLLCFINHFLLPILHLLKTPNHLLGCVVNCLSLPFDPIEYQLKVPIGQLI